jgi:hypothetical protein
MKRSHIGPAALAIGAGIPWILLGIAESGAVDTRFAHPAIFATALATVAILTTWGLFKMREIRAYAIEGSGPAPR